MNRQFDLDVKCVTDLGRLRFSGDEDEVYMKFPTVSQLDYLQPQIVLRFLQSTDLLIACWSYITSSWRLQYMDGRIVLLEKGEQAIRDRFTLTVC